MSIWLELLTALIRAIVQVLVGLLVAHGIVDAQTAGHFTTGMTVSLVAAFVLFWATYGGSIWNKIKSKVRFFDALDAQPGTSAADVVAKSANQPVMEQVVKALTEPGTTPTPKQ